MIFLSVDLVVETPENICSIVVVVIVCVDWKARVCFCDFFQGVWMRMGYNFLSRKDIYIHRDDMQVQDLLFLFHLLLRAILDTLSLAEVIVSFQTTLKEQKTRTTTNNQQHSNTLNFQFLPQFPPL